MLECRLLILSNSIDGTSDALAAICQARGLTFFRWNVDLWPSYHWRISEEQIVVTDPTGRQFEISNQTVVLQRKPFLDLVSGSNPVTEPIERGQIRGILHFLEAFARRNNQLKLVEPGADRRLPKLVQLREAEKYFAVPKWELASHFETSSWLRAVTKPLTESALSDGKIFYTSRVNVATLEKNIPWLVQEEIIGATDVTALFVNGKSYFFECDLKRDEVVDWRTTINSSSPTKWRRLEGPEWTSHGISLLRLMDFWNLKFSRVDFLRDANGTLWFLECNSNGQFGWLDNSKYELHNAVLDATLDPSSAIGCANDDT